MIDRNLKNNQNYLLIYFNFRTMARQLNASCNFNMGYLTHDIPDNMVEMVVRSNYFWQTYTGGGQGKKDTGEDITRPKSG